MRLRAITVFAWLLVLLTAAPAHALTADQLRGRLAAAMRAAGPYSGAYARDLHTGIELVRVREDTQRIPASVTKLFVAATALLRYGLSERLATTVVAAAPVGADGTLDGNLHLVGGGDPSLGERDLRRLASGVLAAGVVRVEGRVVGDESRFDRRRGGPRTRFLTDRDLGGRLGALLLRRGFQVDPARYAAQRLTAHLRAVGVHVRRRRAATGAAPPEAAVLAQAGSPPMADLVRDMLVPSDNFYADMLLKDLGAAFGTAGTTRSGARVVRTTLDDFGVRPRIADGSGLSRSNRTTPRQVVRLFERMEGQDIARTWRTSLALAGVEGTVRRRMRGTAAQGRCRVKTGHVLGVSNLAGVCTTIGGATVGFAWLMNGGVNVWSAHRIQDRMTALLARFDGL